MTNDDLIYKIGIGLIPNIGCVNAKKLIAYTGSPENVFKEKHRNLLKIPYIGESLADFIIKNRQDALKRAEKEIKFIKKHSINPIFYLDNNYPKRLTNCADSPILIYVKGEINFNENKVLSIVGTRHATSYGKNFCSKLIETLSKHGHEVLIVSGLAYGIDIAAHKEALKNNFKTVAILGHGLDIIYPDVHKTISDKIIQQGALVSEFLSGTKPEKQNFVRRNRIVAGMADAVIVVESGIKGGSLITADLANSYNRDVFALPGRVNDIYSEGCNKLIKTNKASLIESADDIEYLLGWDFKKKPIGIQKQLFITLSDEEKLITNLLQEAGDLSIDSLAIQLNLPMSKLSALLLNLEFSGLVKILPGKIYSLC